MKRLLQIVLWFLLGTLIGLPIGAYWIDRGVARHVREFGTLGEQAILDFFAKSQYRYADRESAREALRYEVQIYDQLKAAHALWGSGALIDLAYSYGELSLLEESAGNPDVARRYMDQAVQNLKDAGVKGSHASQPFLREKLAKPPFVEEPLPVSRQ